jgi:N utilization substance protein B
MLFEWDMRRGDADEAIAHYYEIATDDEDTAQPDAFAEELVRGTIEKQAEIDRTIESKSEHWRIGRMPAVDRNIVRLAVFEMSQNRVPPVIVINEALELAREFSGDESLAFINGVLDAVHRDTQAVFQTEAGA